MKGKIFVIVAIPLILLASLLVDILTNDGNRPCRFVPLLAIEHAREYCNECGQTLEGFYQTGLGGCEWRCN